MNKSHTDPKEDTSLTKEKDQNVYNKFQNLVHAARFSFSKP